MSGLQQLHEQDLWAWALTGKDVDKELETAIGHYHRRFGERPLLVYCPENVCLEPIKELTIERHGFGGK